MPEDELDADGDGTDRISDPRGEGPRIWFQKVSEPKAGKNRLHLDLFPAGRDRSLDRGEHVRLVDARVAELVEFGASVLRRHPDDDPGAAPDSRYSVVLADPEGNELCVA